MRPDQRQHLINAIELLESDFLYGNPCNLSRAQFRTLKAALFEARKALPDDADPHDRIATEILSAARIAMCERVD